MSHHTHPLEKHPPPSMMKQSLLPILVLFLNILSGGSADVIPTDDVAVEKGKVSTFLRSIDDGTPYIMTDIRNIDLPTA